MLRSVRIATIAAVLVSAVAAVSAPSASRPPSMLLFSGVPDVETSLGVVHPDGTGRRIISRSHAGARWSPDGRSLVAYAAPTRLAILDDRGHLLRSLEAPAPPLPPLEWSPSGRWIAAVTSRCPGLAFCGDLWILPTDGTDARRLVSAGVLTVGGGPLAVGAGALYDWSPDGRTLAYSGAPESVLERAPSYRGIVLVDALTGRKFSVPAFRNGGEPTWAADGRRLAFTRAGRSRRMDVYVTRRDGRGLRRLTRNGRSFGASWSPKGGRIAYLVDVRPGTDAANRFAIEVADVAHRRATRIARVGTKARLVWSPNGTRLAWSAYDERLGYDSVIVARADGRGRPDAITEGVDPDWR